MLSLPEDESTLMELAVYAGLTPTQILNVFEAILIQNYMKLRNGERIHFPYFGTFKAIYEGDESTPEGREAKVNLLHAVHPQFKRIVGQVEDEKRTGIVKNDAIDLLRKVIRLDLRTKLEELT